MKKARFKRSNARNPYFPCAREFPPNKLTIFAARHDHSICRFEHARWNRHRRLYAASQTSGVYKVSTDPQRQNSFGFNAPSDCRQLWNTQTSTGSKLVKTESTLSSALYSNVQFLGEHDRTMVPRNHHKKNSPRVIQKLNSYRSVTKSLSIRNFIFIIITKL